MTLGPTLHRAAQCLIEHQLAQPDQLSCGAATLVIARAVMDEPYAAKLAASCPSFSGVGSCHVAGDFEREVLLMHRAAISLIGVPGTPPRIRLPAQMPWPRQLGTPPWALARALRGLGVSYRVVWARSGSAFGRIQSGLMAGFPVPLYVGSPGLPRHVTLVVAGTDDSLTIYNPAKGRLHTATRAECDEARLTAATGWPQAWWLLVTR